MASGRRRRAHGRGANRHGRAPGARRSSEFPPSVIGIWDGGCEGSMSRTLREVKLCPITGRAMNPVDFASLLCSRLCHDLMSPVGALNNGIELLADEHDPEMRARCLDLLGESARASANKLKFFRLAFGAAGGFADEVDTREARVAIEGLFGGDGRIQLGWLMDEPTMGKPALKILLNLVLIAGDALVRGGRLDVGSERHNNGLDI